MKPKNTYTHPQAHTRRQRYRTDVFSFGQPVSAVDANYENAHPHTQRQKKNNSKVREGEGL